MNIVDPIVSTIIDYVEKDPEKNLDKIANLMKKVAIMPNLNSK